MRRATIVGPGRVEFSETPQPSPGRGEVLIQVRACGVCGSDVLVWQGRHPYCSYPVIQGHEFAGEIVAVGPEVGSLPVGAKVTVDPSTFCGTCRLCRSGRANICERRKTMGYSIPGAHQDYIVCPEERTLLMPEKLSFSEGAVIEPVAVAVHATKRGGVKAGDNVLIFGAGTIGHLIMQVAKAKGAKVAICDLNPYRLRLAGENGSDILINPKEQDLAAALAPFAPEGLVIFECAGSGVTVNNALSCSLLGGRIVVLSMFGDKPSVDLNLLPHMELEVIGSLMYDLTDFKDAIQLISSGKINLKALITSKFPFEKLAEAYDCASNNKLDGMKTMVVF
jgi:L-iditol 2-dehydrogenase